jgi:hypothetical protein
MRLSVLLLSGLGLCGCAASMGETYVEQTGRACGAGDRLACETLVTLHPQAVRDADAIMAGMQQARSNRVNIQRATQ